MCLSECSIGKVDDYTKALYGGLQSFNGDYEKYLDALYSGDSEKIYEHKKTSKDYYSHLELNIIKESYKGINDIENTSNYLNKKVIEILSLINSTIK